MTELCPPDSPVLAWGMAAAALEGDQSGDLQVVLPIPGGALMAVIDGLGHGPEAAVAARAASRIIESHAAEPVKTIVERCNEGIRSTRGVVMTVASIDARIGSLSWIGVGNVEGLLLRPGNVGRTHDQAVQNRGGVVGYRLPPLSARALPISAGDLLIMATDGIRRGFADGVDRTERDPAAIAAAIMAGFFRGSDDALVVAARYLGGPS